MEPTPLRMDEGAEKISEPMISPETRSVHDVTAR